MRALVCICTHSTFVFAWGWQRGSDSRANPLSLSQHRVSQEKKGLEPLSIHIKSLSPKQSSQGRSQHQPPVVLMPAEFITTSRVGGHLVYNQIAIRGLVSARFSESQQKIDLTNFANGEFDTNIMT